MYSQLFVNFTIQYNYFSSLLCSIIGLTAYSKLIAYVGVPAD